MIDWHSHVLPAIDDGSRDVAESVSLLTKLSEQGVDTVIATPHFLANDESVDAFLERRQQSYESLSAEMNDQMPRVLQGAEVKYYQGISRMEGLKKLRIEGTRLLLLEMPMIRWTEYTIKELTELALSKSTKLVLAHIERYLKLQSGNVWNRLYEAGILMQVNASFFADFPTRRRALGLLQSGGIHFIGSDCHNMTSRPPRLDRAFEIIEKKLGKDFAEQIHSYGSSVLC